MRSQPKGSMILLGSDSGRLSMQKLQFGTAHGIYQERYAYRENLTDVVVQHLMTDQKVRIKARDLVKKVAVFANRLAVQLSDKVIIYELTQENSYDMHYRVKERITQALTCTELVVTAYHLLICAENRLTQIGFNGQKEREWKMESTIRYVKATGGAAGKEGLLVGLKCGAVYEIFVNNPFPTLLVQQDGAIRCLDMSAQYVCFFTIFFLKLFVYF